MPEKQAIYTAAEQSIDVRIFLDDLMSAEFIDTSDPQTVVSVQSLETAGLIGEGRSAEILQGILE